MTIRGAMLVLIVLSFTAAYLPVTFAQTDAPTAGIPASYEQVGDNENFQLFIDPATLAFKLLDKRSGYLWHSGLDELIEGDRLNSSWQAFARSGVSIEYLDERAVNRRVSISNTEHRLEVFPIESGITAQITFLDYDLSLGVVIQLVADGVRVEVPFETIREGEAGFRLGRVYLYPFLGAVRGGSVPGYMLAPDGSGSLIRFADTTRADNMFYGRYYGDDLGIIGTMPWDPLVNSPSAISLPVFGMAHGESQNGYVSIVEEGAAYGELQVHPAGIITNFNFLYHAFIYNQPYFQATNRSGAGVTIVQRQPNAFNAVVQYRFLTGDAANYVGMARSYQQYLVEHDLLHRGDLDDANIGVRLEFLGGDKERILFWNRFVPMTTIAQMNAILDGLAISNPEVIYYGWQPFGASTVPPISIALEGGLGSLDNLQSLSQRITTEGGNLSLYLDPQSALWNEPGYSTRTDIAMAITNGDIEGYNRYPAYYFSFDALQRRYSAFTADAARYADIGLALDSIGWMLFSDFRDGSQLNREAAIEAYRGMLAESSVRLGMYRPNDYLLGFAQAYYDIPSGNNGYIYTSEAVPFLQIVLAGYVPYYGTALNFSSNMQDDLLRHIEYGIYPSYFVTHESTANMLNTPSGWIYTSSYEQWGDQIRDTYQWMNTLLAPVRGQAIIAHEQLASGVNMTSYANGHQIIVNYTNEPVVHDGITVEAKNAVLVENGR